MTNEEKEIIIKNQLNNICDLINGELTRTIVVDSTGNTTNRIIITYKEHE